MSSRVATGGPPSDACLSGSSWRCSKTGLNLSMTIHNENEWMIYDIWYDIPHKLHIWSYNVIYKSQPFVRNQGSWQLVWDLVYSLVKTVNHLRLLRVKLTTESCNPGSRITKKKHPKQTPSWPYLRHRAWAARQQGSSLGLGFRCSRFRRFQATVSDCCQVFRTLEFLSLTIFLQRIWRISWN